MRAQNQNTVAQKKISRPQNGPSTAHLSLFCLKALVSQNHCGSRGHKAVPSPQINLGVESCDSVQRAKQYLSRGKMSLRVIRQQRKQTGSRALFGKRGGGRKGACIGETESGLVAGASCLMISHSFLCKAKISYLYH